MKTLMEEKNKSSIKMNKYLFKYICGGHGRSKISEIHK
jgi:hypothetical protein